MKKSAVLSIALLAFSSLPVYAYTDNSAGYSIVDRNPKAVIRSSNLYAFTDKEENCIAIHTYSATETEKLTGVKFSTKIFQQEYEKLALLKRSQLSLKTLPLPLFDLAKYLSDEQKIFLGPDAEAREAEVRIDKLNKLQAVTLCYPSDENNQVAYASFVSANDRLYIITFSAHDIKADDRDKNDLWQQYLHTVKTFRTRTPDRNTERGLQYYDSLSKKTVNLPSDWVYIQANVKDQYNQVCLTSSVPTDTMQDLIKIIRQDLELKSVDEIAKDTGTILSDELAVLAAEEILLQRKQTGQKIASQLDEALLTASLKFTDNSLQELFEQPDVAQSEITTMLEYSLQRLKHFNDAFFTLNKYTYTVDFNNHNAAININSDISLYKDYNFNTEAHIYCTPKQQASIMLYLKKADTQQQLNMGKIAQNWQF